MNLEQIWEPNRDYIRRILISLTRDVDLAEDLLQETYVKALTGFGSFRGDNAGAWLTAIAKNAFYEVARHKSYHSEVELDADLHETRQMANGSGDHVAMIDMKRAMDSLSPELRTALLMKHYGGFSYLEIGRYLGCAEGTAKSRVWWAIKKLRTVLATDEEMTAMKCSQLRGSWLIDYLYGLLPAKDADGVTEHLVTCTDCRREADEVAQLMTALDSAEDSLKLTRIIDIDENGVATQYDWWTTVNGSNRPQKTTWWSVDKDLCVDYIALQGQEVVVDVGPYSSTQHKYEGLLPTPVEPGGVIRESFVGHSIKPEKNATTGKDGKIHFAHNTCPNTAREWVMALAIRLPSGARFVVAKNTPTEVRTGETTTLVWRKVLPRLHPNPPEGWNSRWQFECEVIYQHDTPLPKQLPVKEQSEWAKTHLRWAPEMAFELREFAPFGSDKARALDLYRRAVETDLPHRFYESWFTLGLGLWWNRCYEEALDAFQRTSNWDSGTDWRFASFAWLGQILDTLGRRKEAIANYQKALDMGLADEDYMQHSNIDAWIDNEWVKERLKTPYQRLPDEVYYLARMFRNKTDKAIVPELHAKIRDYKPANWNFPADLGRLLLDCDMPDEAYEVFQTMYETAQAHPRHVESNLAMFAARAMQAYILKMQDKHEEAKKKAKEALAIKVNNYNHPCVDARATREMVREIIAAGGKNAKTD